MRMQSKMLLVVIITLLINITTPLFSTSPANGMKKQVYGRKLKKIPKHLPEMPSMSMQNQALLANMIAPSAFVIPKKTVDAILQEFSISVAELLHQLVPIAKTYARPPISHYQVGAAALSKSGTIYLGVNLEFFGIPLNEAVHGEQFVVCNARSHGETELVAIALSAAPCGHCRQFLNEIGQREGLVILTPNSPPQTLAELLPQSFGPIDLGITGDLMSAAQPAATEYASSLLDKACEAARISYAPYTHSKSGVAIEMRNGKIYTGSYLENAAYNPTLSPFQAALVALVVAGENYGDIQQVILVEQTKAKISHAASVKALLHALAPEAHLTLEKIPDNFKI